MKIMGLLLFAIFLLFPAYIMLATSSRIHQPALCNSSTLLTQDGIISSPNYPLTYPNYTSCTWVIMSPPMTVLTIVVTDFDIEEDVNCIHPPCCQHSWLSLPKEGGRGTRQYCGHKIQLNPISVSQATTNIKFHTSKVLKGGRGFHLKFTIEPVSVSVACPPTEVQCVDGRCVLPDKAYLCDVGSDSTALRCELGYTPCGLISDDCFNNVTQRCNGIKDCASGFDELNCGNCFPDEVMCQSGAGCYKLHQKCDSKPDCSDFSDELDCGFCGEGQVLCSSTEGRCFSPRLERCNGKMDCPLGEDEVGCSKRCPDDKLVCSNQEGCYSPTQRCDSVRHCRDDSDETNCPACAAISGQFPCDNGRCISDRLRCNDADNCGDASDERSCLKNSVVTTAIVGSLACGLLLVIAVGCVCRLYGLRVTATRHSYQLYQGQMHRAAARHALLSPEDEFFHREPPPAYSVATAESQQLQRLPAQGHVARSYAVAAPLEQGGASTRRSSRRHVMSRRRSQRSQGRNAASEATVSGIARPRPTHHAPARVGLPGAEVRETALEARQEAMIGVGECKGATIGDGEPRQDVTRVSSVSSSPTSSSTNSPSRASVTSSTSVISYLSGNDDAQLLIA